ncbi:hypothetical protein ACQ4PT_061044 [Festuca glaucescens]
MSFRGRGGRGGGGRGGRGGRGGFGSSNFNFNGKHTPHENFPEIPLPEMKFAATNEEKALILSTLKLEEFIRNSCYHLEPDAPKKKNDDKEIERFSDRKRKTRSKRESLKSYLKLTPGNFPEELWKDSTRAQPVNKKLRWDKDSDDKTFEVFEKLEAQHKAGENKAEKDGEDEDDEEEEEVEEEESSDDDYNQNIEFDDDDDDWNQEEEAHEDCYD